MQTHIYVGLLVSAVLQLAYFIKKDSLIFSCPRVCHCFVPALCICLPKIQQVLISNSAHIRKFLEYQESIQAFCIKIVSFALSTVSPTI